MTNKKVYGILYDICSYDGKSLLSIWSSIDKANSEKIRLCKKESLYDESLSVIEITIDSQDIDESVVV
jgi:hypothetical protein